VGITAQGNPRTVFRRAIEHGNLMVAEMTIREIGVVGRDEALELTALMALKGRVAAGTAGGRAMASALHRGERGSHDR
jgi:hypothetical protein